MPLVTRKRLLELFEVDIEAGRLWWKRPGEVGDEAGGIWRGKGAPRWTVTIDGRNYRRSRLVFLAKHGRWPKPMCDHRDGNSLNDGWRNLRDASAHQNATNRAKRQGKSLPLGVYKSRDRFRTYVIFKGRGINIGTYSTIEEAARAYQAKKRELCGEWSADH